MQQSASTKIKCIGTVSPFLLHRISIDAFFDFSYFFVSQHNLSSEETKKEAMNAAAARALDCFSLRECDGTEIAPSQRCEDEPYMSKEDAPLFQHWLEYLCQQK